MHNLLITRLSVFLAHLNRSSPSIFLYCFLYLLDRCSLRKIATPFYVVVMPDKMFPLFVSFHLYRLPPFLDRFIEQNSIIFFFIIIPQVLEFRKRFWQILAAAQHPPNFDIALLVAPVMRKTPLFRTIRAAESADVFIRHGSACISVFLLK